MDIFTINRLKLPFIKDATLGVMKAPSGENICVTAELPWKDNEPYVSCIPADLYQAIRVQSPSRGMELFELINVPNRTHIQLHIANAPMRPIDDEGTTELLGCIAPGMHFGQRDGYNGVMNSTKAFELFMDMCKNKDRIWIEIHNTP